MPDLRTYYEEEMRYLLEAGREFASLHPERARFLNFLDPKGRDPHVERLLEGFAFLAARIRKRLDDDLPDLTHSLLELIWPYYLRPIPSCCIVEFQKKPQMVRNFHRIAKGALIDSESKTKGAFVRFQTCYDVVLAPFELHSFERTVNETGGHSLLFRFKFDPAAQREKLESGTIRIFVHADSVVSYSLLELIGFAAEGVDFGPDEKNLGEVRGHRIKPVGSALEDSVFPNRDDAFPGFRLLQEYFFFPEKFLFFDLPFVGGSALAGENSGFAVRINLRQKIPEGLRFGTSMFRLHCTPAINLYESDAKPIRMDHTRIEYPLRVDSQRPFDYEIFDITRAEATGTRTGRRRVYKPLFSPSTDPSQEDKEAGFFITTRKERIERSGWNTSLSFLTPRAASRQPELETISLSVLCSDGDLAKMIRAGSPMRRYRGIPDFAEVTNLTAPSPPIWPSLERGTSWKLISHLALNILSLQNVESLRKILALHNPGDSEAGSRKIMGIQSVSLDPRQLLLRGALVHGAAIRLEIRQSHFADSGDLRMFCNCLAHFFGLFAPLNSFTQIEIVETETGAEWIWPAMSGGKVLST